VRGLTARRAALGLALGLAPALGGCYTFAAAAPGALPAGARVRVTLTEAGASALAPAVGAGVSGIEGDVVRQGGDTLVVRPARLLTSAGVDVAWSGDTLRVPPPWQRAVDRRRLAAGRTSLLVAGGVAASVGIIALVRGLRDRGGEPGGGGGGPIFLSRRAR
jgi:hypothetical protein